MKIVSKQKEKLPKKEVFLKKALLDAQKSLQDAYTGLANVNEPDLIDSYIYELNAANLRYQVILRDYKLLQSQKPSV
jgi:phosphate uptake regulator